MILAIFSSQAVISLPLSLKVEKIGSIICFSGLGVVCLRCLKYNINYKMDLDYEFRAK